MQPPSPPILGKGRGTYGSLLANHPVRVLGVDRPRWTWVSLGGNPQNKRMGAGHTADQDQIARKTEQLHNCVYYGSGGSEKAEVAP